MPIERVFNQSNLTGLNLQSIARGRRKIVQVKQRNLSRGNSRESSQVRNMFQVLDENRQLQQQQQQPTIEEKLSDQESQLSQEKSKKLMVSSQVTTQTQQPKAQIQRELQDILRKEEALRVAQIADEKKDNNLYPEDIFPEGLSKFVEHYGLTSYVKLSLKLNYGYLTTPPRNNGEFAYQTNRMKLFENINQRMLTLGKFTRAEMGCKVVIDAIYDGSNVILYLGQNNQCRFIELRLLRQKGVERWFKVIQDKLQGLMVIVNILSEIVNHQGYARLAFDDLMMCPMCVQTYEKKEIFQHSCVASMDLAIRRGSPQ